MSMVGAIAPDQGLYDTGHEFLIWAYLRDGGHVISDVETLTKPKTTAHRNVLFDAELDRLEQLLDGQLLVSQDRCIDALLDVYNAATGKLARQLVGEMISDIRFVKAVRADTMLDDVAVLKRYC